jgi:hypothetical protein
MWNSQPTIIALNTPSSTSEYNSVHMSMYNCAPSPSPHIVPSTYHLPTVPTNDHALPRYIAPTIQKHSFTTNNTVVQSPHSLFADIDSATWSLKSKIIRLYTTDRDTLINDPATTMANLYHYEKVVNFHLRAISRQFTSNKKIYITDTWQMLHDVLKELKTECSSILKSATKSRKRTNDNIDTSSYNEQDSDLL